MRAVANESRLAAALACAELAEGRGASLDTAMMSSPCEYFSISLPKSPRMAIRVAIMALEVRIAGAFRPRARNDWVDIPDLATIGGLSSNPVTPI
jgi:hypothetical protein